MVPLLTPPHAFQTGAAKAFMCTDAALNMLSIHSRLDVPTLCAVAYVSTLVARY